MFHVCSLTTYKISSVMSHSSFVIHRQGKLADDWLRRQSVWLPDGKENNLGMCYILPSKRSLNECKNICLTHWFKNLKRAKTVDSRPSKLSLSILSVAFTSDLFELLFFGFSVNCSWRVCSISKVHPGGLGIEVSYWFGTHNSVVRASKRENQYSVGLFRQIKDSLPSITFSL